MTNIQKLTIARMLYSEGYFRIASRVMKIECMEGLTAFIHAMYKIAELRKDDRLHKMIYPIITLITGWSFNPYILLYNE